MWKVTGKKCLHEGCTKEPAFNYPNTKGRKYCGKHYLPGMINIGAKSKICQFDKCKKVAIFNIEEETKGKFCINHKEDNMINVMDEKCEVKGCNISTLYNYPGITPPIRCAGHKEEGMIDVKSSLCKFKDCTAHRTFGEEGGIKEYCAKHSTGKMVNLKSKKCEHCKFAFAHKEKKKYCTRCYYHLNPDIIPPRNHLTKERLIMNEIYKIYPELLMNKVIVGSCNQRRPDGFLDILTHSIIIEIDENQHNSYNTVCEDIRINELFTGLADRPLIFIRFNPDSYKKEGKRCAGLFKLSKSDGLISITSKKKFNESVNELLKIIKFHVENIPIKLITHIYLNYDDDKNLNLSI
jgi:hypothetical protein